MRHVAPKTPGSATDFSILRESDERVKRVGGVEWAIQETFEPGRIAYCLAKRFAGGLVEGYLVMLWH